MSYMKLSASEGEVSLSPKTDTNGQLIQRFFYHRLETQNAIPHNAKHADNALRTAARSEVTPLRRILDSGNRYVHDRRRCIRVNYSLKSLIRQRHTLTDYT